MTKTKRMLSLLLVMLLCLSLCSCKELDAKRAVHAVLDKDGTILWNETVYKPLPEFDDEVMYTYGMDPSSDVRWIQVTAPDLPVLLSEYFGSRVYVYNHNTLLSGWDLFYDSKQTYFCRADCYTQMVAQLTEIKQNMIPETDTYYVGMAMLFSDDGNRQKRRIDLTGEQQEAVENIIETGIPIEREPMIYCDAVDVHGISQRDEVIQLLFQIVWHSQNGYELVFKMDDKEHFFPVPEEYNDLFYELLIPIWEMQGLIVETFPKI